MCSMYGGRTDMSGLDTRLSRLVSGFALPAPPETIEPYGRGLINDSYRVTAGGRRYLLQRINGSVFPDPPRIMANLAALARQAEAAADRGPRIPALIPAQAGDVWLRDPDGAVWRLMEFIEDSVTLARIESPMQASEVGALLGRFHTLAQGLPLATLAITLPGFHDTPAYLSRLLALLPAVEEDRADPDVERCIGFVTARQTLARCLSGARDQGRLPMRVIHGDPKLDNMLLSRVDGRGVALIDLDTVQPGLILHDLGDCLRSCCNRGGESSDGRVSFDLAIAEPLLRAYADETRDWLTADEIALMDQAIRLLPFELGLRFLTDHLEGDRYFKVSARGENLRKAMIQLDLVADIERQAGAIRALVERCFGSGGRPR